MTNNSNNIIGNATTRHSPNYSTKSQRRPRIGNVLPNDKYDQYLINKSFGFGLLIDASPKVKKIVVARTCGEAPYALSNRSVFFAALALYVLSSLYPMKLRPMPSIWYSGTIVHMVDCCVLWYSLFVSCTSCCCC